MMYEEKYEEIREIVKASEKFTITTHVNPDGDGTGSEMALYLHLVSRGKEVRVINNNPVPDVFDYLNNGINIFELYDKSDNDWIKNSDVVFILDISRSERLGNMANAILKSSGKKICIDHHIGKGKFADILISDTNVSATAELVYRFIKYSGGEITSEIAESIYTAILTDTECFSLPNTSITAYEISGEVVNLGASPSQIYDRVYRNNSFERITLFQTALRTLQRRYDGRLAWIHVDAKMVAKSGALREEMGGFVEYLMSVASVEMAMFFLEVPDRGTKVSIRTKGDLDCNKFAAKFGGGGHRNRAGIRKFDEHLHPLMEKIVAEAEKLFK